MTRMIFLNVAWMKRYEGISSDDNPVNGGSYIQKYKSGGEIFNFRPFQGTFYGFVEAPSINVARLGEPSHSEEATDVLVIWTATPKTGGRRIVGWYDHATVFRNSQPSPFGADRELPEGGRYVVSAAANDCVLLPAAKRTFLLPKKGPERPGQANVWYADGKNLTSFRQKVTDYVQGFSVLIKGHKYGSGVESPGHKALKMWCATHPLELGLENVVLVHNDDYCFITGDRPDVVFELGDGRWVVVEVETEFAKPGAHQALKYKVLMCAREGWPITSEKVEGLLVAWKVPQEVREFCETYHLRWKEVPPGAL